MELQNCIDLPLQLTCKALGATINFLIMTVKKIILTLYILSVSLSFSAQNFLPIFGSDNQWYLTFEMGTYGTEQYWSNRDTVFNNDTFHILDAHHYNGDMLVREDTTNGAVYGIPLFGEGTGTEVMLYDFSLQPGDTFSVFNPISPLNYDAGSFIVDSTSNINYLGTTRKTLYLSALDTLRAGSKGAIWIEGVGSLFLLTTPGALPKRKAYGELACAIKDGVFLYKSKLAAENDTCILDGIQPADDTTSVSPETSKKQNSFHLFPNPAQDVIHLELSRDHNTPEDFLIYNSQGQLVQSVKIPVHQTQIEINISSLHPGLYFIGSAKNHSDFTPFVVK